MAVPKRIRATSTGVEVDGQALPMIVGEARVMSSTDGLVHLQVELVAEQLDIELDHGTVFYNPGAGMPTRPTDPFERDPDELDALQALADLRSIVEWGPVTIQRGDARFLASCQGPRDRLRADGRTLHQALAMLAALLRGVQTGTDSKAAR